MIELEARDQAAVLDALEDPDGFSAGTVLLIGEENYGGVFSDGNWGQSDIAIGLECTLGARLPRRREGASTKLYAQVNDVLIPQLMGRSRGQKFIPNTDTTDFSAASWGAFLGEVYLRVRVEYPGVPPEDIIRDCLYRVEGYDKSLIEVDDVGAPTLNFVGQEGFKPQETAADPLSRILEDEQLPYVCRDTAIGGNKTKISRTLGDAKDVSRTFHASEFANWAPPERADPQYSEVEVYRENSDGRDAYRVTAKVFYYGVDDQPIRDTVLLIPFNDDTSDGPANAQSRANERALALSRGFYKGTDLRLPRYYPLIECLDVFKIYERWEDDDGIWDRAWLLQADAYRHKRARAGQQSSATSRGSEGPGYSTSLAAYTAAILEEELLKIPALIVPGISSGVLLNLNMVLGSDASGFWFFPDVPWIGLDETGGWIVPSDNAGLDGSDFWFRF